MTIKQWIAASIHTILLLSWEHYLAKTKRFVAGSTIQLISAAGRFILGAIKKPFQKRS